jgi:hypothetical protein
LSANGWPWDKNTCAYAAEGGHIEELQWLHEIGCPWDGRKCCSAVAKGGHIEVLKWLRTNGCPWDTSTREHAANLGHVEND